MRTIFKRLYHHLIGRSLVAILLVVLFAPLAAHAGCTVTNLNDLGAGSLRDAIATCTSSTITFGAGVTGTITLGSTLVFESPNVTLIQGPGATNLAVSGAGTHEVLEVTAGSTLTISGVTIENGLATNTPVAIPGNSGDRIQATPIAGGGVWNDGTLTLQNSVIMGNSAPTGIGGGIYNSSTGTLTLDHSTIADNTSGQDTGTRGYGGGLENAGTVTITSSTFNGNVSAGGGQGAAIYNLGTATLRNSTISGNESTDAQSVGGGAGAVYSDGQFTMTNCTIAGNTVADSGGGIVQSVASSDSPAKGVAGVLDAPLTPVVSSIGPTGTAFTDPCLTPVYTAPNGTLTNIVAPPLVNGSCPLGVATWTPVIPDQLPDCVTSSNPCQFLHGVTLNPTTPYHYQILQANVPENQPSFIYFNTPQTRTNGTLDSIDPFIMQCEAGAGVFFPPKGSAQARTLFPNGSIEFLSQFEQEFSNASVNCTNWSKGPLVALAANIQVSEKGYYVEFVPPPNLFGPNFNRLAMMTVTNTDLGFCDVDPSAGCGVIPVILLNINVVPGPNGALANTIVAANTATEFPDAAGVFTDQGANLIGTAGSDAGNTGFTLSTQLGTPTNPLNPLLLPLGNYGGLTQTMLPELGSPALGAGNVGNAAGSFDQRDFARVVNGLVDIGADEFQGPALTATGGTPQSTLINTQFPAPLTANLSEKFSKVPLPGQPVNFVAPGTGASATLTTPAPTDANGNTSTVATANGNKGSYNVTASFQSSTAQFALTNVLFAGVPGTANCHGKSVAALSNQFGTLDAAASALGYSSVQALQAAITQFCGN